jgi:hypothetical protein
MQMHKARGTAALAWEVCARSRSAVAWLIGVTAVSVLLNIAFRSSIAQGHSNPHATGFPLLISMLGMFLAGAAVLLFLSVFGCTEFNSQTGLMGFPRRLFVLPVSSFQLVAVPTVLGIAAVELLLLLSRSVFYGERNNWDLLLMPVYLIVYQSVLWTLSSLRAVRLLVVGLIAVIFLMLPPMLRFHGVPQSRIIAYFMASGVVAFAASWTYVARQRSGGGRGLAWVHLMPQLSPREKVFPSRVAAQAWFEWRRSGQVLPTLVAVLLVLLIAPLSWLMRSDVGISSFILVATLSMPVLLALPMGKAFSKPDLWSGDLIIPPIVAVRPLSSREFVLVKLRVAAKSAAISWLFVSVFLTIWLSSWANALRPDYRMIGLAIFIGILLTWRSLISSLWLGLHGNPKLFVISGLPYGIVPFFGLAGGLWVMRNQQYALNWLTHHINSILPQVEWIAAILILVKLSAAVLSWWKVERDWAYLLFWISSTLTLIVLAILLSMYVPPLLPSLVLVAVLMTPLARIGFAQASFERNRHR